MEQICMKQTYNKLQKRIEVGMNIRKARIEKNMTQEYLAQQICQLQNSSRGGNPQTILSTLITIHHAP